MGKLTTTERQNLAALSLQDPGSVIKSPRTEDTNKMSGGAEAGIIDGGTDTGLLFYSV